MTAPAPTPDAGVDVEALRGLLAYVDQGWRVAEQAHGEWYGIQSEYFALGNMFNETDARLTVAAVNALPALLDEVERLRQELAICERASQASANAHMAAENRARDAEAKVARAEALADQGYWFVRFGSKQATGLAIRPALRLSWAAQSDEQGSPGVPGHSERSEALTAPCSRCGVSQVVNARPNDDIVVCEQCAWACGGRAALENAAARCHNGAGDPEQEFYDHGVAPWLTERALEWEKRIDETKERA